MRDKLIAEGLGPSPGHTFLGDFLRPGGYLDETRAELDRLFCVDSPLMDVELFNVANDSTDAHDVITRNRGCALRAHGSFSTRINDPLMQDDSLFGLIRACEAELPEDGLQSVRNFLGARSYS